MRLATESNINLVARDSFPYINSLRSLLKSFEKIGDLKKLPGFSYIKDNELRNIPSRPPEKDFIDYRPIYDILPLKEYEHITTSNGKKRVHIPILGSKGCPYSCLYCPYPLGFGRKPIFKHPKSIVDEIEHLHQMGVEYFGFRNQSFTLNKKWAKAVCKEIINRKLDISWICEARVDETSKEILTKMYNAGCRRIHYGVETGDPTLIRMAKPGVLLQNTKHSFKIAKEIGIWRHAHIILGLPGENKKTLEKTSNFLLNIEPDSVTLNFATPYPGTKMYEIAEKNNWIITRNWAYYSSFDVVMMPPNLRVKDLYKTAMQIKKSLLLRKQKQILSRFNMNTFRVFTNNCLQIANAYMRFINDLRSFRKIKKSIRQVTAKAY